LRTAALVFAAPLPEFLAMSAVTSSYHDEMSSLLIGGMQLADNPLAGGQRCATDALQSICAFLTFPELAAVSTVCRQWRTAAYRGNAATAHFSFVVRKAELLPVCLTSPLRRHLRAFNIEQPHALLLSQVRQVRDALPWLQELHVNIAAVDSSLMHLVPELAVFPYSLTALHLSFHKEKDSQFASAVIEQLSVCCRALTSLTLYCKQSVSLAPLLSLQTPLHHFRLSFSCGGEVSPAQIDLLKQLRHLRELDCGSLNRTILHRLCELTATAYALQSLERLNLSSVFIPPACMHALANLPALTSFEPAGLDFRCFALLPACLPQLRTIHIPLSDQHQDCPDAHLEHLCHALSVLPTLTSLSLSLWLEERRSTYWMERILGAMGPRLKRLTLTPLFMRSLSVLRLVPAVEELCFENGFSLTLHMLLQELPAILPSLRVLRVHDCLSLGAESVALSQLRPPSLLLPVLQCFDYRETALPDDDSDL